MRAIQIIAQVYVLAGLMVVGPAQAQTAPFAECEARFRVEPSEEDASRCFLDVFYREGLRQGAMNRLERYLGQHPDLPWPRFYLGRMGSGKEAVENLRDARDLFEAKGKASAAFTAQIYLVQKLELGARLHEAETELERAREMRPEKDSSAGDQLELVEAAVEARRGALDNALEKLNAIKDRVVPGGRDEFRQELFFRLGHVYYELGRYREAGESWERSADICRALDNRYREAVVLYNTAITTAAQSGAEERQNVIALYRNALRKAKEVNHKSVIANSYLELAKLFPEREERRQHIEECLSLRKDLDALAISGCLGVRAFDLASENPEEAKRVMDQAIEVARAAEDPWPPVYLWSERLSVSWRTLPRDEALEESLEVLEDIERIRETQLDDAASAGYFSVWVKAYHWLAGKLLESSGASIRRTDLEQAFEIIERYRARVLLERLHETRAWHMLPQVSREELRSLPVENLGDVEDVVEDDEAVLIFQLGDWRNIYGRFAGGSWLLVVTRGGTRVYRLGDRSDLEKRISEFMETREDTLAENLYKDLLNDALRELPTEVGKLLIVPDGGLHRIPFGALRSSGGDPLSVRYEFSLLPSVNIWIRWRALGRDSGPALVFADPVRPAPASNGEAGTGRESESFLNGIRHCRKLPFAREEGEAIRRRVGRSSVLRLGEKASEGYLKQTDLRPFGLIHVASHAFIDKYRAEKSLVCLAPGDGDEDGNLEIHEIVHLELDGQLVVLASCDSASGPHLAGEGVMSLARAFFVAGARAVVASLERLDDAEAKDLFIRFYGQLAKGRSVSSALHAAKKEIFDETGAEGATANSAWTNVVVLGDGAFQPLLAEPATFLGLSWFGWIVVVLVIYLISIGIRVWLQRR